MATTTAMNCTISILTAINDYAICCGLTVNEDNAFEAACFIRDTVYAMYDEEIEIDLDELDQMFNIYSF
nr:MAG TPA: hypothetical protein [Caudoviricetes sp.]